MLSLDVLNAVVPTFADFPHYGTYIGTMIHNEMPSLFPWNCFGLHSIYDLVTIIFNHLQHYSINNAVLTSVSLFFKLMVPCIIIHIK